MHPWLFQIIWQDVKQASTKDGRQDARWPRDAIPQSFLHNAVLVHEDGTRGFSLFGRFCMINKQAKDVEQSCKPSNYKDDVERFNDAVIHAAKVQEYLKGRIKKLTKS